MRAQMGARAVALAGGALLGCSAAGGAATIWWTRKRSGRSDLASTYSWYAAPCDAALNENAEFPAYLCWIPRTNVGDLLSVATETAAAAQAGFLITVDKTGQPHARVVDPLCGADLKRVWFVGHA